MALIIGVGVTLATLEPTLRQAPFVEDSFPFSTYPMFARALEKRTIVFAEGTRGRQPALRLGPALVANDEPMQAQRTLQRAASGGPTAIRTLCERIAGRVAASEELSAVRRVRIVQGAFTPLRYFEGDGAPEEREVLGECRVRRRK